MATHHYSKSCPPAQHYFSVSINQLTVGACVFRKPSLPHVEKAYNVDLELVRLVLLDECPKNSESRFIGWTIRWLKKHTSYKGIISFADPRFGHEGIVYRASNFEYLGKERGHGTRRIWVDGREYHPKSAFDKWGASGASLKQLLPGRKVEIKTCPPKHVYRYKLT